MSKIVNYFCPTVQDLIENKELDPKDHPIDDVVKTIKTTKILTIEDITMDVPEKINYKVSNKHLKVNPISLYFKEYNYKMMEDKMKELEKHKIITGNNKYKDLYEDNTKYPNYYGPLLKSEHIIRHSIEQLKIDNKPISLSKLKFNSKDEHCPFDDIYGANRIYICKDFWPLSETSNKYQYFDAIVDPGNEIGIDNKGAGTFTGALRSCANMDIQQGRTVGAMNLIGIEELEGTSLLVQYAHKRNFFHHVIETQGPRFTGLTAGERELMELRWCYYQVLECAKAHQLQSIFIPNISGGVYSDSIGKNKYPLFESWFPMLIKWVQRNPDGPKIICLGMCVNSSDNHLEYLKKLVKVIHDDKDILRYSKLKQHKGGATKMDNNKLLAIAKIVMIVAFLIVVYLIFKPSYDSMCYDPNCKTVPCPKVPCNRGKTW